MSQREPDPRPTPEEPEILQLPPNHGARLRTISHDLVTALCHVDRLFRPHFHDGAWWLRLRDSDGPMTLLAADYYLFRRVLAMEQLAAILEEADAILEAGTEADQEPAATVIPLFVWGRNYGPEDLGKTN